MYRLVILPLAKIDIQEAADWYNSKEPGLGKRFATHVRRKINRIKKNPLIYVTRYDNVKTAVLDVFPFMIHYIIDDIKKTIVVSAVLHTSRNPDIWETDR